MKLAEALATINGLMKEGTFDSSFLACGFEPLHLKTFLAAHLAKRPGGKLYEIETGLYGNLVEATKALAKSSSPLGAIVIEWQDLDPRLGLRALGGWSPSTLEDILATAKSNLPELVKAIEPCGQSRRVAVSLPTIPLPPIAHTPGITADSFDLSLRLLILELGQALGGLEGIHVIDQQHIDMISPAAERYNIKTDLKAGFPYTTNHADRMGKVLAAMLLPTPPKKGIITDLDDTFWRGILGEEGVDGVTWDLDNNSHVHALYQQMLNSLADTGVLVAVASKNDHALVDTALERKDLHISKDKLFPIEAHWEPKSLSIARILDAWNIGADSVVFIDDSPMELAQVENEHPDVECILFQKDKPQTVYDLLTHLRDTFGKDIISEEDKIRRESLRSAVALKDADNDDTVSTRDFLAKMQPEITIEQLSEPDMGRPFELVNKTNQFNLNGERLSENDWVKSITDDNAFCMVISYKDKFGPLGKISVLLGHMDGNTARVTSWVLSCRAFSRRIEHHCLATLVEETGAETVLLDYKATERNGPTRDFITELTGQAPEGPVTVMRERVLENNQ